MARLVARPPPVDCGCQCTDVEACDLSSQPDAWLDGHYKLGDLLTPTPAIYINNCRFGLHGPIEVFSSGAVTAYVEGLPQCEFLTAQPWGEDKYLDRCMMTIGVTRVNIFALLSEAGGALVESNLGEHCLDRARSAIPTCSRHRCSDDIYKSGSGGVV